MKLIATLIAVLSSLPTLADETDLQRFLTRRGYVRIEAGGGAQVTMSDEVLGAVIFESDYTGVSVDLGDLADADCFRHVFIGELNFRGAVAPNGIQGLPAGSVGESYDFRVTPIGCRFYSGDLYVRAPGWIAPTTANVVTHEFDILQTSVSVNEFMGLEHEVNVNLVGYSMTAHRSTSLATSFFNLFGAAGQVRAFGSLLGLVHRQYGGLREENSFTAVRVGELGVELHGSLYIVAPISVTAGARSGLAVGSSNGEQLAYGFDGSMYFRGVLPFNNFATNGLEDETGQGINLFFEVEQELSGDSVNGYNATERFFGGIEGTF